MWFPVIYLMLGMSSLTHMALEYDLSLIYVLTLCVCLCVNVCVCENGVCIKSRPIYEQSVYACAYEASGMCLVSPSVTLELG